MGNKIVKIFGELVNPFVFLGGGRAGISGFNVAKSFALSKDLESQAEELISRIKRNVDADLREDWKVCDFS